MDQSESQQPNNRFQLDDKFRMPSGGDHNLLITARAFARDATPMAGDFVRYGMPQDFLDDLNSDIAEFEQATSQHSTSFEQKVASGAAIEETIEQGLKALKQLDRIMHNVLRNDVGMLTAWITASHVERVPHRRKQPPVAPAPEAQQ